MTSASARRIAALTTSLALAAGLSSCASKDSDTTSSGATPSGSPTNLAQAAEKAAEKAGNSAMLSQGPAATAGPNQAAPTLTADTMPTRLAAALERAKSLHFEIPKAKFGGMDVSSSGQATTTVKDSRAAIDLNLMGPWKMIYAGGETYVKPPMQMPGGKPWMRLSSDGTGASLAGAMSFLNPTKLLLALQQPGSFKVVGPATIDGVKTQQYKLTLSRAQIQNWIQLPSQMQAQLPKVMTVRIWMDANDLPRQLVPELPAVSGQRIELTMKLGGFGTPVNASAPPKSQVGNFSTGLPGAMPSGMPSLKPGQMPSLPPGVKITLPPGVTPPPGVKLPDGVVVNPGN